MKWPRASEGLSVDPGADTTWASGPKLVTEPTAVAVDASGTARACGSRAVLVAARRGSGLRLTRPFTAMSIVDPLLTRTYLRWVIETAGCGRLRVPLMVVVPAVADSEAGGWRELAESIGVRPLVVERPVAAVVGLGLDDVSGAAQMVVDAEHEGTETAVVVDGVVVGARHSPPLSKGLRATAAAVRSLLVSIDPDHELDIADRGINLVGRQMADMRLAGALGERVGLAINVPDDPGRVVIEGARRTMETMRPYLPAVLSRRVRRRPSFKAARGGSAR
ncbi:MAG: rod shape-determining protein [Acidimicrobiia bacterium]